MNYEIITLEEKTVMGIAARTNNSAPDMGMIIGGLWQRFYSEGIYHGIPDKRNNKALGIYTEYAGKEWEDYTIMVACEVEPGENREDSISEECKQIAGDITTITIPAGKYARYIVKGDVRQAVARAWQEIWNMDLPRSYVCDFEEYQNEDMEQAEIHIYIGLAE